MMCYRINFYRNFAWIFSLLPYRVLNYARGLLEKSSDSKVQNLSDASTNEEDQLIEAFKRRFGQPHLDLAYHAAFPLALTTDLLYYLWIIFSKKSLNKSHEIPWIAVADLLLSGLLEEVGDDLYQMDKTLRKELLKKLEEDERFGAQRKQLLAQIMITWLEEKSFSLPDDKVFYQSQKWAALSYLKAEKVAQEITLYLAKLPDKDTSEFIRIGMIVESLEEPLARYNKLFYYARGLKYYAQGMLQDSITELQNLPQKGNQVKVMDKLVSLPLILRQEKIKLQNSTNARFLVKSFTRRQFLQIVIGLTLGSGGLVLIGLGYIMIEQGVTLVGQWIKRILESDIASPPTKQKTPTPPPAKQKTSTSPLAKQKTPTVQLLDINPLPKLDSFVNSDTAKFPFTFTSILVDSKGKEVSRIKSKARGFTQNLGQGFGMQMVEIRGGSFVMGSPRNEEGQWIAEGPQNGISVSDFYIGRYPVTQAQWRMVARLPMIARNLAYDLSMENDDLPVEGISWEEAVEFCARLTQASNYTYRLPSEAEWEYACRAGTTTPFHFGETITTNLANYRGDAYVQGPSGKYRQKTTPVNHFRIANAFGLADMHGNVWEWCEDRWHGSYAGIPKDGSAWVISRETMRVLRGGSWSSSAAECRSASRNFSDSDSEFVVGVRVVCVLQ